MARLDERGGVPQEHGLVGSDGEGADGEENGCVRFGHELLRWADLGPW